MSGVGERRFVPPLSAVVGVWRDRLETVNATTTQDFAEELSYHGQGPQREGLNYGHGIPPTGAKVIVWGVTVDVVRDGRLAESRIPMDTLGLMRQLEVVPSPET